MFKVEQVEPRFLSSFLWTIHGKAEEKEIFYNKFDHLKSESWVFQMLKLSFLLGTGKIICRSGDYISILGGEEVDEKLLLDQTGEEDMVKLIREWELIKLASEVVPPYFLKIHPTWGSGNDKTLLYAPVLKGEEVYVLELVAGIPAMVAHQRKNGTALYDLLEQRVEWIGKEEAILAIFLRRHRLPPSAILQGNPDHHLSAFFQVFDMPFRDWRGN